ncbi:unnamed protein product [Gongylonema pulchrum]|uniref:Ovule protein n=1 Tax=Gongylonema pulchrum TaxID=637853 RepID=A0A183EZ93_9BILA|nr:unnamed protein product [Gongylonema pulchrum]
MHRYLPIWYSISYPIGIQILNVKRFILYGSVQHIRITSGSSRCYDRWKSWTRSIYWKCIYLSHSSSTNSIFELPCLYGFCKIFHIVTVELSDLPNFLIGTLQG